MKLWIGGKLLKASLRTLGSIVSVRLFEGFESALVADRPATKQGMNHANTITLGLTLSFLIPYKMMTNTPHTTCHSINATNHYSITKIAASHDLYHSKSKLRRQWAAW